MLLDPSGRVVRYLRLSLTRACPMRCTYCRPATLSRESVAESEEMTRDEIVALVSHLVARHGLRKVRLTGGEPTARLDLLDIVASLAAIDGLDELAMTTNGLALARQSRALAMAGLARVNVSLDSLDERRFERITGTRGLAHVLAGIDAALAAGLTPLKLNAVVVRGENDEELPDLLRFAAGRGVTMRFIELMPMGPLAADWAHRYVPEREMRQRLDPIVRSWTPLRDDPAGAAQRYRVRLDDGSAVTVGFIAAMSCPFCSACDRIRIGADGAYYPCLMDAPAGNLLGALRPTFDPAALDERLGLGLQRKAPEHPAKGVTVMLHIGG